MTTTTITSEVASATRLGQAPESVKSRPDDAWIEALQAALPVEAHIDAVLTRKLRRRGRDTHRTVDTKDLRGRLDKFLSTRLSGPFEVSELAPLPGGASKEMFSFTLRWHDDGASREDRMVLRMSPPASVVETNRLQEAQVLRAVAGHLPAPECFWATEDLDDFGEPAIITGLVRGVNAPTSGERAASGVGTNYGAKLRPKLAQQYIQHIATLHSLDWRQKDLSTFDVPTVGTTEAAEATCRRWFRVWAEDSFEDDPVMALARRWLWENRPTLDSVSLLHGDYRNGNFLFDEATGDITAILDWELACTGDRHLDLSYALLPMWGHEDEEGRFVCSGMAERESLIAEYQRLSGLSVDPERLRWYSVLNLYWLVSATRASGVRAAASGMSHLGVMLGFVSAIAADCTYHMHRFIQEA